MSRTDERLLGGIKDAIQRMHCSLNSLGEALTPGTGPVPPVKNFQTIKCCDAECNAVFVTTCYATEIIYIPSESEGTIDSNSKPCKNKCGIPTTVTVDDPGTYEIGETTETRTFTYADGTPFTGDPTTLDPTCSLCMECDPQIQDVCLDEGATYIPFTTATISSPKGCCTVEVVTSAGTFYLRKGMTQKCIGPFSCPVTIDSITITSGTCTDEDVCIQLEAKGCYECGLT